MKQSHFGTATVTQRHGDQIHRIPWTGGTLRSSRTLRPWVVIRQHDLSNEGEVYVCVTNKSSEHQPPHATVEQIMKTANIRLRIDPQLEFSTLAWISPSKECQVLSLMLGIHLAGQAVQMLYRGTWRKSPGIFDPVCIPRERINWHSLFLGYHIARGEWGDVVRFCHAVMRSDAGALVGVFERVIPTFAQALYEGHTQGTFVEFMMRLNKKWFQGKEK